MSRLFGRRVETRDITQVPWNVGAPLTQTVTQDRALHLTPVFAALRHIIDFGSTLPMSGYRKIDESTRQPITLPKLFADLETDGRLVSWLGAGLASVAIRGNAVGWKVSADGWGFPTAVEWVSMDRVYVDDATGVGQWYVDGRKVSRLDLVHIPWMTLPGRTLGLSPIEYYAATISSGLESQKFGNDWFGNGGYPPSVFRNTEKTLPPGAAAEIGARLRAAVRKHQPMVTGRDWEFTPITVPPEQAQFIETQKLSANQVAAIYGIDPTEVGGEAANSLTYSTEELRQINRAANMRPYLSRFERAFASWLPERQYVRFNTDATIRTDTKTRHEVYKLGLDMGLYSVNEIRELEDRPPIAGGDSHATTAPAVVDPPEAPEAPRRLSAVRTEREEAP